MAIIISLLQYVHHFSMVVYFQTLQLEHGDLASQVDAVRDSAIDLMNRSEKYHKTAEPELTQLNQRWEEISVRLKVPVHTSSSLEKLLELKKK